MADHKLEAQTRTLVGKKVKRLRQQGYVPGVIYGQSGAHPIQVDRRQFATLLRAGAKDAAIDLDLDGDSRQVIVQELQQHVTRGDLLHVDFLEVLKGQKIQMTVTLHLVGRSVPAATASGTDLLVVQQLNIETIPSKMIGELEVDASLIKTPSDSIMVSELTVPEGVEILDPPDTVVAKFEPLQAELTTEADEDDLGEGIGAEDTDSAFDDEE